MNLTRVPKDECIVRHIADSLTVSPFISHGLRVLDIGCGPGFPAWPLACARPDLTVTAMDSSGKMLGFLEKNRCRNLATLQARAEDRPFDGAMDVTTGRAVAPLGIQIELSARPLKVGGFVLPMRTPADLEGVKSFPADVLGLELEDIHSIEVPTTDVVRLLPVFRKVKPTPRQYPRSWAEIRRSPLH